MIKIKAILQPRDEAWTCVEAERVAQRASLPEPESQSATLRGGAREWRVGVTLIPTTRQKKKNKQI